MDWRTNSRIPPIDIFEVNWLRCERERNDAIQFISFTPTPQMILRSSSNRDYNLWWMQIFSFRYPIDRSPALQVGDTNILLITYKYFPNVPASTAVAHNLWCISLPNPSIRFHCFNWRNKKNPIRNSFWLNATQILVHKLSTKDLH